MPESTERAKSKGGRTYADPSNLYIVGLDGDEGPDHPLYDERARMEVSDEAVQNVLAYGILEDVGVRLFTVGKGSRTEVVYGRQRVKWARAANKLLDESGSDQPRIKVPYSIVKMDPKMLVGVIEAENNVRTQDDALTRSEKAKRMVSRGHTEREVAVAFGVTTEAVRQWLKLTELSADMQKAVKDGVLTPSAAIAFSDLSHEDQDARLAQARELGVTISTSEARRQRSERTSGKSNGEARGVPIGRNMLKKLADHDRFTELPPESQAVVRWILGERTSYKRVAGLAKILRDLGAIQ